MPYTIVSQDGKFCVYKKDPDDGPTGETLGCHDTQEDAVAQIGAVESQEKKNTTPVVDADDEFVAVPPDAETGSIDVAIVDEEGIDVKAASAPQEEDSTDIVDVAEEVQEASEDGPSSKLRELIREIALDIEALKRVDISDKGTLAPQVDVVGECFCGECGHSELHNTGEPCVDKYCPKCSATMMARSAKKEGLLKRIREVLYSVGERAKELVRPSQSSLVDLIIDAVQEKGSSFFTIKQSDGRYRWVGISSTAFLDREDEIVSSIALQKSALVQVDRGPLLFWHTPEVVLGDCDFAMHDGMCLIESGLWDDNEVGKAARLSTERNPDLWKLSIGFFPDLAATERQVSVSGRTVTAVYNEIRIGERSQLPAEYSANVFSRIDTQGGIVMIEAKQRALEELLGVDVAARLIEQVDGINALVTDKSAVFKDVDEGAAVGNLVLSLQKMIDEETDPEKKAVLIAAGQAVSFNHQPTEEQKEAVVRDGLATVLDSLPECELRNKVAAAIERTEEIVKEEVVEDGKTEEDEKSVPTDDMSEQVISALKTLVDQVTSLNADVARLKNDSTTRGGAFRPSQSKENVNPDAVTTVVASDEAKPGGVKVLDSMIETAMGRMFGSTEDSNG